MSTTSLASPVASGAPETAPAAASLAEPALELVVFRLGQELYGVNIHQVREIIPRQAITRVPRTQPCVLGVTNLRGRIIPVLDLRRRLNLQASAEPGQEKIAVAEIDGQTVGMLVDGVSEVLQVESSAVEPSPATARGVDTQYITGVAKIAERLVILLDLRKVLAHQA